MQQLDLVAIRNLSAQAAQETKLILMHMTIVGVDVSGEVLRSLDQRLFCALLATSRRCQPEILFVQNLCSGSKTLHRNLESH
jgi:hypothetical protein